MLAAIEAWNPVINAFHHVDGEAALDQGSCVGIAMAKPAR